MSSMRALLGGGGIKAVKHGVTACGVGTTNVVLSPAVDTTKAWPTLNGDYSTSTIGLSLTSSTNLAITLTGTAQNVSWSVVEFN